MCFCGMAFFHRSCVYGLLILFFMASFFSTQKSDLVVCNSLAPSGEGLSIKIGVMISSFCLFDNKAGVSNICILQ